MADGEPNHLPLRTAAGTAKELYLGYLFVESRLQLSEGAEHVYAAVIGHGIDHLRVHLIARYPGTASEYWWTRVDEWPGAPRGGASAISAVAERFRAVPS